MKKADQKQEIFIYFFIEGMMKSVGEYFFKKKKQLKNLELFLKDAIIFQCAFVTRFLCVHMNHQSGRRNLDLQLTTSRTQGGMSRGKKSRKNR